MYLLNAQYYGLPQLTQWVVSLMYGAHIVGVCDPKGLCMNVLVYVYYSRYSRFRLLQIVYFFKGGRQLGILTS